MKHLFLYCLLNYLGSLYGTMPPANLQQFLNWKLIESGFLHANDPCGDPARYSDSYAVVEPCFVTKIKSADKVEILLPGNRKQTVYLAGISCNFNSSKDNKKARRFLTDTILGQKVTLLMYSSDELENRNPRVVIEFGLKHVNLELLRLGLARYHEGNYKLGGYDECTYELAANNAKANKLGVWASK
jgi:endonuclease YncB( thermonuclease family)